MKATKAGLLAGAAALAISAAVAPAAAASTTTDTATATPDKYLATGDSVKVLWQGFAGATDVRHTIVQAQNTSQWEQLVDITGSTTGQLTVTCDFTRGDGVTVSRDFNNTVALDAQSWINWGENRRNACDVVTEVAITVPVTVDHNDNGKTGHDDARGPLKDRDAYLAAQALSDADPNLRISVRADY